MNKKTYLMPAMRSVEMRHKLQMLDGSPGGVTPTNSVSAGRNSYGSANQSAPSGFSEDANGRWVWN